MEVYIVGSYLFAFLFYALGSFRHRADKSRFLSTAPPCFLTLGFSGNIFLILRHIIHTHRLPLTNMPETLLFAVTFITFVFLTLSFFARSGKNRSLGMIGVFISLISSVGLFGSFWFFKKPFMPLLPALQSKWLVFHVSSCIIAYCFFTISFISAIIYISKKGIMPEKEALLSRLYHRSISMGFFLLTLGIILGSVWGKSAWGHWWNWDPKETWALITWLIYAGYIHGRLFKDWPEKRFAWITILGFLACLFTYLGVNYLLKGLHSYA